MAFYARVARHDFRLEGRFGDIVKGLVGPAPINITVQLYFRHKIETTLQLAIIKLTVSLFKYS